MVNARSRLPPDAQEALQNRQLFDLLYADDTLILGTRSAYVEQFAAAVKQAGLEFGMSLHWAKTQALTTCSNETLHHRGAITTTTDDGRRRLRTNVQTYF